MQEYRDSTLRPNKCPSDLPAHAGLHSGVLAHHSAHIETRLELTNVLVSAGWAHDKIRPWGTKHFGDRVIIERPVPAYPTLPLCFVPIRFMIQKGVSP